MLLLLLPWIEKTIYAPTESATRTEPALTRAICVDEGRRLAA